MSKIKQLSSHEAQKIAAGEVVERPANIVKELIENAIDAYATRISIYVEDGGKQLIRVVDNGCGMDITDAQKCFDRHATSKITAVDELENIDTFGFRGEALASIASVSKIVLLTKEEDSLEGTKIILDASTIMQVCAVGCATGTDITIQDLFYNVPARKKFLKATQTEWRAIQLLINAFCLDYPNIHFNLFSEGKHILNCPVSDTLKKRIIHIFEPPTHAHLHTVSSTGQISFDGIISDHQQYRYDRSSIYFFVNKRWVKNPHLSSALIKGYANLIPNGRYPIAAIHITVPSQEVDINIHPRKEEVKFLHPRRVEQALQNMVKTFLEKNISQHISPRILPTATPNNINQAHYHKPSHFNPFDFDMFLKNNTVTEPSFISSAPYKEPERETTLSLDPFPAQDRSINEISLSENENLEKNVIEKSVSSIHPIQNSDNTLLTEMNASLFSHESLLNIQAANYRLIGQYHLTYLLIEKEEGLFLVDQHAAHERILYELFSQRFHEVATIQLLFPQIITLSPSDMDIVLGYLSIFIEHGILVEQCASDQLIVQSLPVYLKNESIIDIIKETISSIIEYQSLDNESFHTNITHALRAQMACKAAVKAGDLLTREKMEQLLIDLDKTANRFACPHGRPTGWLLSLSEIEKKFKRRL